MGLDWNKIGMQTGGDQVQNMTGMPSDMVTTAMMGGYRPNMYANPYQQMQNMQQFIALQKNMMDAQMGGANGAYAKMSPANPMAMMPLNYQNYYNAMSPLFTNPQWSPTMPGGGPAAGNIQGYQFGGVSNQMAPAIQAFLQSLGQGQSNQLPSQSQANALAGPSLSSQSTNAMSGGGPSSAQGGGPQTTISGVSPAQAKALQMMGINSVPTGQNPSDIADNAILQILNRLDQGNSQQSQPQQQQSQGGSNGFSPLAFVTNPIGTMLGR